MKNLTKPLNIEKIEKAIEDGWVTKRKHPDADLYILNYSPATQIEFHWDKDTTMICRGLIVDNEWNVVARPFPKFFTVDQLTTLRNSVHNLYGLKFKNMFDGSFRVFDKLDGSLGVLYPVGDKVAVATRGSFESEMAIRATKMLEDMGLGNRSKWFVNHSGKRDLFNYFTFMVEIIYPENQIVVNYGDEEKLVMLAVLGKNDGEDAWQMFEQMGQPVPGFELAKEYDHIKSIDDFTEDEYDGREGYVLVFDNGLRVKWKFNEYKRLHRIVTGLNENTVLEWLKEGKNLRQTLDKVPDEFYNWAETVANRLTNLYREIEQDAKQRYMHVKNHVSRKEIADSIKDYKYRGLVFAMLDGKSYEETIWRIVKEKTKNEERLNSPSLSD